MFKLPAAAIELGRCYYRLHTWPVLVVMVRVIVSISEIEHHLAQVPPGIKHYNGRADDFLLCWRVPFDMEAVDAVIDAICSLQQHPSHSAAQHLRPTTAQPYTWCLHSLAFASGLLIVGGGQTQNKGFPVHVRLVNVNFLHRVGR